MNMDTLTKQALEQAIEITGKPATDKETQNVAFHLACAVMAQYAAERFNITMFMKSAYHDKERAKHLVEKSIKFYEKHAEINPIAKSRYDSLCVIIEELNKCNTQQC